MAGPESSEGFVAALRAMSGDDLHRVSASLDAEQICDEVDWWRATIDVQHVEKGDVPEQQVTVAFPSSQDVRWHTTPKPVAGQDGVWVLHATEGATRDIAPFQLADSEDFRSLQDLDLLRGMEVNS